MHSKIWQRGRFHSLIEKSCCNSNRLFRCIANSNRKLIGSIEVIEESVVVDKKIEITVTRMARSQMVLFA